MSKKQRRGIEEFSVSFLDVICCGFGAIILLLMITKTVEPIILEQSQVKPGKVWWKTGKMPCSRSAVRYGN